jgi:AmpD protein
LQLATTIEEHRLLSAETIHSSHQDQRPEPEDISLLVIHNISLPPSQFGGDYITQLFTGVLDPNIHPYFRKIYQLRVSAHCLIKRDGSIIQFVAFDKRAWHAGYSCYQGRDRCNDYSIGVELEGTDHIPYSEAQYVALAKVSRAIMQHYPRIGLGQIVGHNDIAPRRKSDPGLAFDWPRFRQMLA